MSEWNYIVAAYALTWVGLAAYALYLRSRGRQVAERLREMESGTGGVE